MIAIPFVKVKCRTPRQVISDSWDQRDTICEEDVNLFCWERTQSNEISSYLEQLLVNDLETISFQTDLSKLDEQINSAKLLWEKQSNNDQNPFWQDIKSIIQDFISSFSKDHASVRLEVVDNNACTKFHVDGYTMRLFTTYYGKGTEWLPESATNRKGLGKTNDLIVKDQSKIRHFNTYDVGILKGEIPGNRSNTRGIVHRSPEIETLGEKRVTLRIDV